MKENLRERCRSTFSSRLFELANIPFQKACWNGNISHCQSSFNDVLEAFEFFCDEKVALEYVEDQILNRDEVVLLLKLTKLLNESGENVSSIDFEKLWRQNKWIMISKLAKEIYLKHFENDERDYYQKYAPEELIRFNELVKKFPLK